LNFASDEGKLFSALFWPSDSDRRDKNTYIIETLHGNADLSRYYKSDKTLLFNLDLRPGKVKLMAACRVNAA